MSAPIPRDYEVPRVELERLLEVILGDNGPYCLDPVGTKAEVASAIAEVRRLRVLATLGAQLLERAQSCVNWHTAATHGHMKPTGDTSGLRYSSALLIVREAKRLGIVS